MTYLRPLDILHLARTTKEFRAFLMKPSSEFIWKTARENVEDFPPRPDDLSEPAYANLAFDSHCHVRSDNLHIMTYSLGTYMLRLDMLGPWCEASTLGAAYKILPSLSKGNVSRCE